MALESGKKSVQTKKVSAKKPVSKTTPKKLQNTGAKKLIEKPKKIPLPKAVQKKSTPIAVSHARVTKNTRIKISDNTQKLEKKEVIKKVEKEIIPRNGMQLAMLSPFRFPMPKEAFVANFARVMGVFFVVIGAFFSLLNLNAATGVFTGLHTQNLAQTVTTTDTGGTVGTSGSQTVTTDASATSAVVDTTPDVHVTVGGQSPLSDSVFIYVNVFLAQEVKILAQDTHTGNIIKLGMATLVDNTNWKYTWDTKLVANGTYALRIYIKNQYGIYEYVDTATYTVENTTATTQNVVVDTSSSIVGTVPQSDTSTTTVEQIATTTVTSPTQQVVTLTALESSPLRGAVAFKILAHEASEVKVYARNSTTYTLYYVGLATLKDVGEWLLEWNSKNVPDGSYELTAKATFAGAYVKSPAITVSVDNIDEVATDEVSTTTPEQTTEIADPVVPLEPNIAVQLSKANPLNGFVDVYVETSGVEWVELYAVSRSSLTPFFLGLAKKMSDTKWKFTWQTTQSPNGDYDIYARVRTSFGFTEGSKKHITIRNEVTTSFTNEQESTIDTLSKVNDTLIRATDGTESEESQENTTEVVYVEPVSTFIERVEVEEDVKNEIEALLNEFKKTLHTKINELAVAMRANDTDALQKVKNDIENLKKDVLQKLPASIEKKKIIDDINSYISQVAFELEELTQKNETILRDRVGNAITFDADKDGVSDYDEVNLYRTNPFAADTDGDSYIDGTEIKLGYNPNDSRSEALVQYESPKETGVVREDLLTVESIITMADTEVSDDVQNDTVVPKKAFISGKGLPNSFVTLYIYSTPIVVTVKTDEQGSWSYVFDKELENGNHEVYVGITDNNGRVVAKSNPLPFVKTAEAFTKADSVTAAIAAEETQPSLIAGNMMLLIASIAVVALGLVLILLGFHVRERELIEPMVKNA